MKVTKDLTEGNIYKNFLLYAIPLILSSLLSHMYSTVDAVIAGKFISEHALGAISATGPYDTVFYSFFNGFGAEFAVYVAHLFGKKDHTTLKRDAVQILMLLSMVIVAVSTVSILLRGPILDYLKVDSLLRADAETYFIIYTAGYLVTYINLVLVNILHALGVTTFSFYVSLASALMNIGGNLLTVLVFAVFAEPIVSLFFPAGYTGAAFEYAVRFARFYTPFVFIELMSHLIHSYIRSLGMVNVVLGITVLGSLTRLAATLLLVPILQMEGAFIGQVIGWGGDAIVSIVIFLLFYRTHEQILRCIERVRKKKEKVT